MQEVGGMIREAVGACVNQAVALRPPSLYESKDGTGFGEGGHPAGL